MLRSRNGTEWNQNGIGRENKQHDLVQVPGSNTESGGPHAHRMHPKHDQNKRNQIESDRDSVTDTDCNITQQRFPGN